MLIKRCFTSDWLDSHDRRRNLGCKNHLSNIFLPSGRFQRCFGLGYLPPRRDFKFYKKIYGQQVHDHIEYPSLHLNHYRSLGDDCNPYSELRALEKLKNFPGGCLLLMQCHFRLYYELTCHQNPLNLSPFWVLSPFTKISRFWELTQ